MSPVAQGDSAATVLRLLDWVGLTEKDAPLQVKVVAFAPNANGVRRRALKMGEHIDLNLEPTAETDNASYQVANVLQELPKWTWELAHEVLRLQDEICRISTVPPPAADPRKTSLLGVGCLRFDGKGDLWLLNTSAKGWASFGFCVGTWDNLFRHYNVRVGAPTIDGTGQYWPAEPLAGRP